jgi:phosphatidylglycerol lysyltransferase
MLTNPSFRLPRQTRIGLWITVTLTAVVGLVNLISAVMPHLPKRVAQLEAIFSFEVQVSGRLFSAVTGFILLTLATNLLRRKCWAWRLTQGLLVLSMVSHILKGFDIGISLLSGVLWLQLWVMRGIFTARSDRPSIGQGLRVLVGALLFTLAYGTAGFFFMDREYAQQFNLWDALVQTLAMFFTDNNAGLVPKTRLGHFFADSIYTIGAVTLIYALGMLLRPVLSHAGATLQERERAKRIVEQHGNSSLARFTLLTDKSYYFSPSGQTVIAYVPKGRGAIALGDPIGPVADREEAILGYQQFCAENDWYPAFYQTLPDHLELYQSLQFRVIKIGEEAVINLNTFSLAGKAGQNFRTVLNKFSKQGISTQFYAPPIPDALLKELRGISDSWLQHMHGAEKRFSLGWFEADYLRSCAIAVVLTAEGQPIAFANVVPEYQKNGVAVDLMRYRSNAEKGTMDFLLISLFQQFQTQGYERFNLGLSALSGVGQQDDASRLEKGLHYLYYHLDRFYRFQGIHAYKEKFHPIWEPRYLVFPRLIALPEVVVALVRADSGDRLWDYIKPGA